MGFSGGGSNVTLAHTHSSAIVQDGGALDFDDVTQASGAAGDITYSDGNALQLLSVGSASDILQVNAGATAPEWTTPTGGGATLTRSTTSTSTEQSTTSTAFIDATGYSAVLQAGAGMCLTSWNFSYERGNTVAVRWSYSVDGDQAEYSFYLSTTMGSAHLTGVTETLSAQTAKAQFRSAVGGNTTKLQPDSGYTGSAYWLEIS